MYFYWDWNTIYVANASSYTSQDIYSRNAFNSILDVLLEVLETNVEAKVVNNKYLKETLGSIYWNILQDLRGKDLSKKMSQLAFIN